MTPRAGVILAGEVAERTVTIHASAKKALRPLCDLALSLATYRSGVTQVLNGIPLQVDARSRLAFPPSYDKQVTHLLTTTVHDRDECWNVGANVGVHVLQLCRLVGAAGKVIAFEPNPTAAMLLARNVALNGYTDRVEIMQAAVGQHAGSTDFFIARADPMCRADFPNPRLPQTRRIRVDVTTLDRQLALCAQPPKCVLIDIEGWEIGALLAAETLLQLDPLPLIVVELHPDAWAWSGHSAEQLEVLLRSHHLEVTALSEQHDVFAEHGQVLLVRR